MTQEFLLFAGITLLLRLKLLLSDRPALAREWWEKCLLEVLLALVALPIGRFAAAVAVVSVVLNAAAIWWERRGADRNGGHLLLGLLHLAALSVCFAPATGLVFRPWIGDSARAIAEWSALGDVGRQITSPRVLTYGIGLLLAANEANLFIRWMLARLQLRPGLSATRGIDANEYARGRVIGLLERALIYFFILHGHYGAVGFTLAAKGFTRFKELDDRPFAEYVLIGTLLSSGLAIAIAVGVRSVV